MEGFHQDWSVPRASAIIVKGAPTTLGQQAELNARRVGKEQLSLIAQAEKEKRASKPGLRPHGGEVIDTDSLPTPWYRDGSVPGLPKLDRPLDLSKIPNTEKYIHEGVA